MNPQLTTFRGLKLRSFDGNCSANDIRVGYALACILKIDGPDDFNVIGIDDRYDWMSAAEQLGYATEPGGSVPALFEATPLAGYWEKGHRLRCASEMNRPGTREEWDELSAEAQSSEWDSFQVLCARGIGDEHRFYSLLMEQWMVGYVGH
jgi:hypothetical protein